MGKKTIQEIISDIENADLTEFQLDRIIKIVEHKKRGLDRRQLAQPIQVDIVAENLQDENRQLWEENTKLHTFLEQANTDITNMYKVLESENKLHVILEGDTFSPYYTTAQMKSYEQFVIERGVEFFNKILAFNDAMDTLYNTFQTIILISAQQKNPKNLKALLDGFVGDIGKYKAELTEKHLAIAEPLRRDISPSLDRASQFQYLVSQITVQGADGSALRDFIVEHGNDATKELFTTVEGDEFVRPGREKGIGDVRSYIFEQVRREKTQGVTWGRAAQRFKTRLRAMPERQRNFSYLDQEAFDTLEKIKDEHLAGYMRNLNSVYSKSQNS